MKTTNTFLKVFALFFLLMSASGLVFAGNENGEQGSSQGKPFQSITEIMDDVSIDLQSQINDLELQILANDGDITQLDQELFALRQALNSLEGVVEAAHCDPGWSIRDIGPPLVCEKDDVLNQYDEAIVYGARIFTDNAGYGASIAYCPEGFIVTGCGYHADAGLHVIQVAKLTYVSPRCAAAAIGLWGSGYIQASAFCLKPVE